MKAVIISLFILCISLITLLVIQKANIKNNETNLAACEYFMRVSFNKHDECLGQLGECLDLVDVYQNYLENQTP